MFSKERMTITFKDEAEVVWQTYEYNSWEIKDNFLFVTKGSKTVGIYNMKFIKSILFI